MGAAVLKPKGPPAFHDFVANVNENGVQAKVVEGPAGGPHLPLFEHEHENESERTNTYICLQAHKYACKSTVNRGGLIEVSIE